MSKGYFEQVDGHEELASNPAGGFDRTRQAQWSAEGITPLDWCGDVLPYRKSSTWRTADAACLRSGGMKALTYSTATLGRWWLLHVSVELLPRQFWYLLAGI